jgi:hypothetical protein
VVQHNGVFTAIHHDWGVKDLLWILPSDVGGFQDAASLLLILAMHRGIIKLIVQGHGIKILVGKAQLHRLGGHCDVIKLLGVIAKDKDFAIEFKKFGGHKMLLKVISWGVQHMHDMHLNLFCDFYQDNQDLDECQHVVMCHLEAFLVLLNHEEGLENVSTTYGTTELFDVMRAASELWSSAASALHETTQTDLTLKLIKIKYDISRILSSVASTLVLMAKLHQGFYFKVSSEGHMRSKDVLSKVSQLEGMVIDEHPVLKEALKDLLAIAKSPLRR